eukprot:g2060.t1
MTSSWWLLLKQRLKGLQVDSVGENLYDQIVTKALLILLDDSACLRLKIVVLIFLQEHSALLFCDNNRRLIKFMRAAEHLLGQGYVNGQTSNDASANSGGDNIRHGAKKRGKHNNSKEQCLLQAHLIVTMTTTLVEINAVSVHRSLFEGFVVFLCRILLNCEARGVYLRQTVCESLRELELAYPCLLESLLGELLNCGEEEKIKKKTSNPLTNAAAAIAKTAAKTQDNRFCESILFSACKAEVSHASQSYVVLLLTVLEHAAKRQSSISLQKEDNKNLGKQQTGLVHKLKFQWNYPYNMVAAPAFAYAGTSSAAADFASGCPMIFALRHENEISRFQTYTQDDVCLPSIVTARVIPVLSYILNHASMLSFWGRTCVVAKATSLALLTKLPAGVLRHHLFPLLYCRSPMVVHSLLLLHAALPSVFPQAEELLLARRICSLITDPSELLQIRVLALQWLLSFPASPALPLPYPLGIGLDTFFSDVQATSKSHMIRENSTRDYLRQGASTFAIMHLHHRKMFPCALDPLDLRRAKLKALLRCFHRDPRHSCSPSPMLLSALECVHEFQWHSPDSRFTDVAFSYVLEILVLFPHLCYHATSFLRQTILAWPRFIPRIISLVDRYISIVRFPKSCVFSAARQQQGAVGAYILHALSELMPKIDPIERLQHPNYFRLMERVAAEKLVDPREGILLALSRYVKETSICRRGTWKDGTSILRVCRILMTTHPSVLVLQPLSGILRFLLLYFGDLDVRDRASFYLQLLTHLTREKRAGVLCRKSENILGAWGGAGKLDTLLSNSEGKRNHRNKGWKKDRMGSDIGLRSFLPPASNGGTVISLGPSLPRFLKLTRSTEERCLAGLRDGGCADITLGSYQNTLTRRREGKNEFSNGAVQEKENHIEIMKEVDSVELPKAAEIFKRYCIAVNRGKVPLHIHLPYRLTHTGTVIGNKKNGKEGKDSQIKGENRRTQDGDATLVADISHVYALVLELSPCPDFLPVQPVRLPYLCALQSESYEKSEKGEIANLGFPYSYKVVLALQPLAPVSACFDVRAVFTDANGRCCEGSLPRVKLMFQDLFLPIPALSTLSTSIDLEKMQRGTLQCLHAALACHLFPILWQRHGLHVKDEKIEETVSMTEKQLLSNRRGTHGSASSVKMLPLCRRRVLQCIIEWLSPFIVPVKTAPNDDSVEDNSDQDDEEEAWYARSLYPGAVEREKVVSKCIPKNINSTQDCIELLQLLDDSGEVSSATKCRVAIFIPPNQHILMKFVISQRSTLIRIRTDAWQILSEIDSYFSAWIH